jgi:hypothetical protein
MEQRGVTEVEVRSMLERATSFEPNVVESRFMIHVRHLQRPWIAIAEPDADEKITAPGSVSLERLNQLLLELGEAPLAERNYGPVLAA